MVKPCSGCLFIPNTCKPIRDEFLSRPQHESFCESKFNKTVNSEINTFFSDIVSVFDVLITHPQRTEYVKVSGHTVQ